ncbi:hypothetical protein [Bradyrhizobium sp. 195]|uniref:hypothetical protein n=1 Tax=Bradyrhizobium sp. 195 TaxID=2782662 RepID=UPI00200105E6|nr:hypothetical protein [Bradyrhizobium sp. 195]UPK31454.1 hypothetical protein IVB26_41465 [Bradyrhizobium sp. 195]
MRRHLRAYYSPAAYLFTRKFICEQNIANFKRLLADTNEPSLLRTLRGLLAANRRELALLQAEREWS